MSFTVIASLVKSTELKDFEKTVESVLGQSTDELTFLIIDHDNFACSEYALNLAKQDPRIKIIDANGRKPYDSEYEEALKATTSYVRFMHFGQVLLPGALKHDSAFLKDHDWVASVAIDDLHGQLHHPQDRGDRPIEVGTVVDCWSEKTVNLPVHPMTVAYQRTALPKYKPTLGYGYYTEMLAVTNEHSRGYFYSRPTMIVTAKWLLDPEDKRPIDYLEHRMNVTNKLKKLRNDVNQSGPELWVKVSDYAWLTREEGHIKTAQSDDSLWDILVQARKYHYRFDWWGLTEYVKPIEHQIDDLYLAALSLTAKAAARNTEKDWQKLIYWYTSLPKPHSKIAHLVLTVIFETGLGINWLVLEGIKIAETLASASPTDAVVHYRLATFYRVTGDAQLARANVDTATKLLRGADPDFSDHLRERLLVEKLLTVAQLPKND